VGTGSGSSIGASYANVPVAEVSRLPQVTGAAPVDAYTVLQPASATLDAPLTGAVPGTMWRRKLLAGRLPAAGNPDEVDVSFTVTQASPQLRVGDALPLVLLGAAGKPVRVVLRVVGIESAPGEFPPQNGTGIDFIWATPAFARAYGARLLASPGVAILGLLILGQLHARLTAADQGDSGTLRAIGVVPRQLTAAGLVRAALIGGVGAVLTVVLAVAASPVFPVGLAGIAELHAGIDADWTALLLGAGGVLVATVGVAAWPRGRPGGRRRSRQARRACCPSRGCTRTGRPRCWPSRVPCGRSRPRRGSGSRCSEAPAEPLCRCGPRSPPPPSGSSG
jgi:hypothetical protein